MTPAVIGRRQEMEAETFKERDRDVNALVPCGDDAITEPGEAGLIESGEIELSLDSDQSESDWVQSLTIGLSVNDVAAERWIGTRPREG